MELRLDLKLSQKLVMTPQLQQAIKLLQLSRLELQQTLSQHLMENPLLEEVAGDEDVEGPAGETGAAEGKEGTPAEGEPSTENTTAEFSEPLSSEEWDNYYESDWRAGGATQSSSSSDEDFPSYEQTLTKPTSLEDHLLWQLRLSSVNETEQAIGTVLIGNIDEDGYIRTSLEEVAEEMQVSLHQVENALDLIQTFDPPGVGARDLQECLNIQLRHLHYGLVEGTHSGNGVSTDCLLKTIVAKHLPDLQKKRYQNIAKEVGVTLEEVYDAVHIIEGLEPKPGRPYFSDNNQIIIPDVFVFKDEGEWVVLLNEDGLPRVQISPYYKEMVSGSGDTSEATKTYLEDKVRGAQWIIRSLDQRNKTILKVVHSLIHFQEAFLEKGIQYLKPLVLKQVAEDVGMHESTISRVTTNKYMYCPQGMLELKFFFNAGIGRSDPGAEDLSSLTVRELIREMVSNESASKPLKDQEIVTKLKSRGIIIARRTVAKYRAELNIAPASQRKRIPS
ncbi:RNA polymerase factor sigma-54 [Candidatus Nitronereus thalassa]|uniref:RNA polymerase factor sigma-54 n=1 Tax=Candidatus Nitronereus thalassa TaxID=3020898 RepID=A0ABU3KC69_9BACT|nr:RNA polymerase factor sigma-54 [Candidatus Nitronereus thalassa]MDT7043824.1 RNA polymerase factor sigma-54 [Candidatus Nitronereus thalassa]